MRYVRSRLSEKIIWCMTVFLFASFYLFEMNVFGSIILFAITIGIFLISLYQTSGKIYFKLEKFHIIIANFAVFCIISSIWAWNKSYAIEKGITIFEILICMSIIYSHYSKMNSLKPLIDSVMWAGFIVVIYSVLFYGMNTIISALTTGNRLGNSFSNINSIGMISALAVMISLFNSIYIEKKIKFHNFLIIPSILIIASSGSRKSLVFLILGIVAIILFKFIDKQIIVSLIKMVFIGVIMLFLIKYILSLPMFSMINERMDGLIALVTGKGEIDHSSWLRKEYINTGMNQFYKTPLIGIGMGNARILISNYYGHNAYVHNNFVELLTNGGIIGFISYYAIHMYILVSLIKRGIKKNPYNFICFLITGLLLVMDYGAVSYYSKSTYFYFMFIFLQLKYCDKNKIIGEKKKNEYI
ncbi:MAG: O-antigen ligase family protein [Clostridium sp.]|nr:O-antigen ligase family protein [Clostridium sp.]